MVYQMRHNKQHHVDLRKTIDQNFDFLDLLELHDDAVVAFDTEGMILEMNTSATRLSGYSREELLGACGGDFLKNADIGRIKGVFTKALDGKQSAETTLLRKTESPILAQLTFSPVKIQGATVALLCVAKDITAQKITQGELVKSTSSLSIATQIAQVGTFECDLQENRVYYSDGMCRIFGIEPGMGGIAWEKGMEFVHPDDRERIEMNMKNALAGKPEPAELRIVRPDGTERIIMSQGEVICDESGQMVRVIGAVHDLTERKAEQQRLEEIEQLYNLISEHAQDIISYSTPDGICRYVSPAITRLLGYEPEEVVGQLGVSFYHPDDVRRLLQQTYSDEDVFTCRVLHKHTGEYKWFETTFKKIYNADGEYIKVLGVGRDITSRIGAEEELRATKDRLETFIEYNAEPIVIFDQNGDITRVNQAFERVFGWSAGETVGVHLSDAPMIPEHLRTKVDRLCKLAQLGEHIGGLETTRITRDGRTLNIMLSTSPIYDAEGKQDGWSAILKDITEKKRAEELLLQSEKLSIAGQLAAGIAHEIRNPLTALKGFTQLMKAGGERSVEYLKIMESELNRIELILSELLVLAKPQAQRFEKASLLAIMQEVTTLIESQAIMHNIEVQMEVEPDLPLIPCDQNQLKQVFINFLKNAIEAMSEVGGVLALQVEGHGDRELCVRIKDEGCGIPEERVKRIGEPFYTTKEKGTGLGLMVSKKIIETHRGRMHVTSQVGVGTTVEVYLPHVEWE